MGSEAIGAILSEIHGLLHEARSNVEVELGKGQKLIEQVAQAESANSAGTLSEPQIAELARTVSDAIKPSIEKEVSIDNPEAAVIQIQSLLDRLLKLN